MAGHTLGARSAVQLEVVGAVGSHDDIVGGVICRSSTANTMPNSKLRSQCGWAVSDCVPHLAWPLRHIGLHGLIVSP